VLTVITVVGVLTGAPQREAERRSRAQAQRTARRDKRRARRDLA
jgi:hypothetical protein